MPDTSVSSCVPLGLSSCYPNAGVQKVLVRVGESVRGFFKRNCLGLQKFLLPTQSSLVFAARSCGDLSSWHWNPGLGILVWGWDSFLLRYPFQIFIHHTWVGTSPLWVSTPPTSLDGCSFFNSVVVRLPLNLISDGSEWWLLYILDVILMWLCEEVSYVCLCCYLDWKS